jgi:4-hydroxy-tetrahydrodipicolinate reductase
MTIRVGVFGAAGRMGATACASISAEPDLELVAAVVRTGAGTSAAGITLTTDPQALLESGAEVGVDFTVHAAAHEHALWCAGHGLHAVIGTTGFTEPEVAELRGAFTRSNCIIAPNFAVGAVLMMRFAELAAPFFESAEIVELHHDRKADAPSGTAMMTADRMAAASPTWGPDPTVQEVLAGARGARGAAGIPIHAVRLRGLVAHQEVLLGTTGQSLTIRHDSYDRAAFMSGTLLAIRRVADHPGVTVGLDAYLGL